VADGVPRDGAPPEMVGVAGGVRGRGVGRVRRRRVAHDGRARLVAAAAAAPVHAPVGAHAVLRLRHRNTRSFCSWGKQTVLLLLREINIRTSSSPTGMIVKQ